MEYKKLLLPIVAAGTIISGGVVHEVTQRQYDFTGQWEGVRYVPYADPANPRLLTVCRGITNYSAPGWVVAGKRYTKQECFNKEVELMQKLNKDIAPLIKHDTTQEQREMLSDFVWNVGITKFKGSSLLMYVNSGDCLRASEEFNRWVYAGGKKWLGIANRRHANSYNYSKWCTE